MCRVEGQVPGEVFRADDVAAEFQFNTGVTNLRAVTCVGRIAHIGKRRYSLAVERVRGEIVIVVDCTGNTAVQEGEVNTKVKLPDMLPSDVGVDKSWRSQAKDLCLSSSVRHGLPAGDTVAPGRIDVIGCHTVLVTGDTEAGTDLCVVKPALRAFHPRLGSDSPAGTYRPEVTPAILLDELGGAITAERS